MKHLATFKVPVRFALNGQQREAANRAINIKFIGKERFDSLDPKIEPATDEHQDAAYALNRSYHIELTVGLCPDGTLEVL